VAAEALKGSAAIVHDLALEDYGFEVTILSIPCA
jgi:hypothetical protein